MKLHRITLPRYDNSGQCTLPAMAQFEAALLELVGGYTALPIAAGAWKDWTTGKVYHDRVRSYEYAMDNDALPAAILAKAFELFPDQLAIFTCVIGTAEINDRPAPNVLVRETITP